jgi:hypothetical protein
MLWQQARNVPAAPDTWSSASPDAKLIEAITAILAKKASKQHPPGCVLVINVYPDITSAEELEAILGEVQVPGKHPFQAIYVAGLFPTSSFGSAAGYRWWKLV